MPIKAFRLGSTVVNGVGGPETGAIEYIYAQLLHQLGEDHYSVFINQVGPDMEEIIMKGPGKQIHLNTQFRVVNDFDRKSQSYKNGFRLEVIHDSMLRLANKYPDYDVSKLEQIKSIILANDFSFEFKVKRFRHPRRKELIASIVVQPGMLSFEYFIVTEMKGVETSRSHLYSGITNFIYLPRLFQKAKWRGESDIIITGKDKVVETHVQVNESQVRFINLTPYPKPPYFELMKAGLSEADKQRYFKDWMHSLPSHIAAALSY